MLNFDKVRIIIGNDKGRAVFDGDEVINFGRTIQDKVFADNVQKEMERMGYVSIESHYEILFHRDIEG